MILNGLFINHQLGLYPKYPVYPASFGGPKHPAVIQLQTHPKPLEDPS